MMLKTSNWDRNDKLFRLFLLFNLVIATLIPTCLYRVLPLDTIEAVIWGQEFTMGNYKHPPLSGWLANGFSALFGYSDFAVYFLSQLCVLISYIYIYRLAREFFSKGKSIIASVMLALTMFYSFDSAKFNVNVLHLALWPMTAFYFIQSVKSNRILSWVLLGISAGLCVFCKLFGGVLLVALFLYMLFDKEARKRFSSPGPYISAILAILIILPYFCWMYSTDFLPLRYVGNRVMEEKNPFWHPAFIFVCLVWPILPILAGVIASGGVPAIKRFLSGKPAVADRKAYRYSALLLWFPILFMTGLTFLVPKIDPMWCYPIYFPAGIFFLSFVKDEYVTPKRTTWALSIAAAVVFAFQIGDVIYFMVKPRVTGHFPAHQLAQDAEKYYREYCGGADIPYIYGATMWHGCVVQHYLPSGRRPLVCIQEDPLDYDRFHDRIAGNGAFFIAEKPKEIAFFRENVKYPLRDLKEYTYVMKASWTGKTREQRLYFGIIDPVSKTTDKK